MKWDSIKNKCVREAHTAINNEYSGMLKSEPINFSLLSVGAILDSEYKNKYENTTLSRSLRKEITDEVIRAIDNWDIRCWSSLQKVFPKAFPKNVQGIELGENGWVLY